MRRAIIVIVTLFVLSVAVIVVIDLRVKGEIVLPSEQLSEPAKVTKESSKPEAASADKEGEKRQSVEQLAPAPDGDLLLEETNGPPEGYVWWGGYTILKEARIPNAHLDCNYWEGYGAPVSYTNDGKLVVASKYSDHRSCLWSYDLTSNEFTVLYSKTRNMALYIGHDKPWRFMLPKECSTPRQVSWEESSKEYRWEYRKDLERRVRHTNEWNKATLRGNRNGDECYNMGFDTSGWMFRTSADRDQVVYPLNKGALELVSERYITHVGIPFISRDIGFFYKLSTSFSVRDTVGKRVISTKTLGSGDLCMGVHDFGDGLLLMFVQSLGRGSADAHVLLARYPELRVIGCSPLPKTGRVGYYTYMASVKVGLTVDAVSYDWDGVYVHEPKPGEEVGQTQQTLPKNPILCRIRVPQGWREAPGKVGQNLLWDDNTTGCLELDITETAVFDLEKWDASFGSDVEGDPFPENFSPSFAYRDGVMYWRKRHTGEVVMASLSDLDKQTVIGDAGTTWDGFRLNPIRDEMVTWRENGELVFWNAQFPEATPLVQARVITDETPHRLEVVQ